MTPMPTDGQLVLRAAAGERTAFDDLIRRHQRQAVAVAYRLLGNTPDALEVTQDAFLRAYRGIGGLQKPEAFGGWLLRIVSNLSLNYRRNRKHRSTLPLDDLMGGDAGADGIGGDRLSGGGDPLHRLQGQELGRRLQEALAKLPEKQRRALVLFTVEQLPQKDVAEQLKCSVEAVKWHVFQGRKKLREMLKDDLED
jgi:RNA polymerase sigma-70 factor (ECF subfamily)